MLETYWSSELSQLQEMQKREYREWVTKVHEDMVRVSSGNLLNIYWSTCKNTWKRKNLWNYDFLFLLKCLPRFIILSSTLKIWGKFVWANLSLETATFLASSIFFYFLGGALTLHEMFECGEINKVKFQWNVTYTWCYGMVEQGKYECKTK